MSGVHLELTRWRAITLEDKLADPLTAPPSRIAYEDAYQECWAHRDR